MGALSTVDLASTDTPRVKCWGCGTWMEVALAPVVRGRRVLLGARCVPCFEQALDSGARWAKDRYEVGEPVKRRSPRGS